MKLKTHASRWELPRYRNGWFWTGVGIGAALNLVLEALGVLG